MWDSLVKQPTLRRPATSLSGCRACPFPFFHLPRDEGHGAPGGAGRPARAPCGSKARSRASRRAMDAIRRAPCEGARHPSDVGVRRLPALHRQSRDQGHVSPSAGIPLPVWPMPGVGIVMLCSIIGIFVAGMALPCGRPSLTTYQVIHTLFDESAIVIVVFVLVMF
jgi:hypothetical protein